MKAIARHPGGLPDDLAGALDDALQPVFALASRASGLLLQRVSSSQLQALLLIEDAGSLNLGGLAEGLSVIPSSATRLAQRLLAADLISREPAAHDRREVVLTLTPTGERMVATARQFRREQLEEAVRGLSERDRRSVLHGLQLLGERLDGAEDRPAAGAAEG